MPKEMSKAKKRRLEETILPAGEVGKYSWPITVEAMEQQATLRLLHGRKRIVYDWSVPQRLQKAVGQARITRQVPAPQGSSVASAQVWVREWLRNQVLDAEAEVRSGGGERDRTVRNDLALARLLSAFASSEHFKSIEARNSQQADEIRRWMAFYRSALGDDWRLHQMSPDILKKLLRAYQEPWVMTLPDGSTVMKNEDRRAGRNTAAKVVRYLKTICNWALSEPDGPGEYLLDEDPFTRIRNEDIPRERESEARSVGVAPEPYTYAMYRRARSRGLHGQFALMFAGAAATGRRIGEWRKLPRSLVLQDYNAVRTAIEQQTVRRMLPNEHIPDEELDQAAKAYLEVSGVVVWFRDTKQAAADPDTAAQHDRVIPIGPWLAEVLEEYQREHWEPLDLPPGAPLCPAAEDTTLPTSKDLIQTWWERTESVVEREDRVRIPDGRTHTLRRRFRSLLRRHDDKSVAFYAGWTLRKAATRDRNYLAVDWHEVLEVANAADKLAALRHLEHRRVG